MRSETKSTSGGEKKMKFEEALKKLEEIVGKLEQGEVPLEKAIQLYEEGMKLAKFCSGKLEEAEKKIEILTRDENGNLKKEPFPAKETVPEETESSSKGAGGNELF